MIERSRSSRFGLLLLLAKLGSKCIPGVVKAAAVLLKTKTGLAALSFTAYSAVFSWQFASVLMISLGIHEAGHVWAMRRSGIPTRGFYFIPFFGGAAVPDRAWHSQKEHLYVALMGPIWGTLVAVMAVIGYLVTAQVVWAGIAAWVAVFNLVNLLPVYPLDGGRVLHSVILPTESRRQRILFIVLTMLMIFVVFNMGIYLFAFVGIVGLCELIAEDKRRRTDLFYERRTKEMREIVDSSREIILKSCPDAFERAEEVLKNMDSNAMQERVGQLEEWVTVRPFDSSTREGRREAMDAILKAHRYEWAIKVAILERRLEEFKPMHTLEGLNTPQRLVGLGSYFLLACVLALLVISMGGVDGAGAALQALQ